MDLQAPHHRAREFSRKPRCEGVSVHVAKRDSLSVRLHRCWPAHIDPCSPAVAELPEGFPAGSRRGFHLVHADDSAWSTESRGGLDRSADGQEAESIARGRARVRQDWPRRHIDRSSSAHDDRNDRAPPAESEVAERHDEGEAHRRDGQGGRDDRIRQRVGSAHPGTGHDADHWHSDASRHQGDRPGHRCHRGPFTAD